MPANKSALLRYRIIDSCLTNKLKKYPTLEDIQERIEDKLDTTISESMINKDFSNMKKIYDAPISYNRVHKGYYYTEDSFSIQEFPLTHEEIDALDFSTSLLQLLKGTRMLEKFENAINKVTEGYRISKLLDRSEKRIIQVEEPIKIKGNEWLEPLLKGIVDRQTFSVFYQPFGREEKAHIFSPYLLKEYRNRWYAVGYSNRIEKVIVIALDRINKLEPSNDTYVTDENFNADDFFKYSFGITQVHSAQPETVLLSFTPYQAPYIISHPLHHSQQTILESEEEVQVQLHVYLTHELTMAILSYGNEVKVLAPEKLKEKIKTIATELSSEYV